MNLLKTAGNLDAKISDLQFAAEKCNYMLEDLCNSHSGTDLCDDDKVSSWENENVVVNIAQDYSREMVETVNEASKLFSQLFDEAKELQNLAEGRHSGEQQKAETQDDLKSSIVGMLDCANERQLRNVYYFLRGMMEHTVTKA